MKDLDFGSSKVRKPKAEEPKPDPMAAYAMPYVQVGDSVMWTGDLAAEPDHAAIVTQVFTDSIHVLVLVPNCHNGNPVDGVRHEDFPDRTLMKMGGGGKWKHTRFRTELMQRLESLENALAELIGPVNTPAQPAQ